jgi:hypothetical protein
MATTSRFPTNSTSPNQDNTGRVVTYDYQNPAYAATLNIVTTAADTVVKVGALTGAITVNIGVGSSTTAPFVGDTLTLLFSSTPGETVTLGTGTSNSAGTLVIAAGKKGSISYMFDGASWVETGRAVTV